MTKKDKREFTDTSHFKHYYHYSVCDRSIYYQGGHKH